ncbi:MAG: 5-formyltetrahydrofolate cyclo-ligase [Treponema sp.]|jgi:5-formyltetrahydrofolate cyclo-ligase|nr:5-formyltetrahydrofolate cyclo-ligase [Treponema sp.]
MNKQELRVQIKKELKFLPPVLFHDEGLKAARILQDHPLFNEYPAILVFLPLNNEIDTLPLAECALAQGKKVFVPKVEGTQIQFYRILSTDGPRQRGPFGIREPLPGNGGEAGRRLRAADFPALILVPGLAFTGQGKRLGRGGGYYDRFLASLDAEGLKFTAIGFCMAEQIVDDLPTDTWDRKMDGVLTGDLLTMKII